MFERSDGYVCTERSRTRRTVLVFCFFSRRGPCGSSGRQPHCTSVLRVCLPQASTSVPSPAARSGYSTGCYQPEKFPGGDTPGRPIRLLMLVFERISCARGVPPRVKTLQTDSGLGGVYSLGGKSQGCDAARNCFPLHDSAPEDSHCWWSKLCANCDLES